MEFENITFRVDAGVAVLTLNRPQTLNSFTVAMHQEVAAAVAMAMPVLTEPVKTIWFTSVWRLSAAPA